VRPLIARPVSPPTADQARTRTRGTLAVSLLALALGAFALAGCGGSSSTTSTAASAPLSTPSTASTATQSTAAKAPAPAGALSLEANSEGQLKFSTTSLTAKAGKVSIDFTNMSPLAHNMTIESSSHKIVGATPTFQGGSKTLTLDLKPGAYKFFCSVPGHRMAGMEGTLTVK
jgi:plastocyanin